MDSYFSQKNSFTEINKHLFETCMLTALFISAKYYEKDSRGPTAKDIEMISQSKYRSKEIISMESQMLRALNWDLMIKTPADYVDLFINQGVLFSND